MTLLASLAVEADAERPRDATEGAVPAPPVEPVMDRLLAPEALGQLAPGRPGPEDPRHAAEGGAVVAPPAAPSLPRDQWLDEAPFTVCELASSNPCSSSGRAMAREEHRLGRTLDVRRKSIQEQGHADPSDRT